MQHDGFVVYLRQKLGDDSARWRHRMETFSALLALCAGNSPVTGGFPSQRPVTRSFDVFFDMWLNKRHRAHYDVIVMINLFSSSNFELKLHPTHVASFHKSKTRLGRLSSVVIYSWVSWNFIWCQSVLRGPWWRQTVKYGLIREEIYREMSSNYWLFTHEARVRL